MDKKIKILANDGIHETGKKILSENNFLIYDKKIPQEQLVDYINNENIVGLVVRSATKVREDIINNSNIIIVGQEYVGIGEKVNFEE